MSTEDILRDKMGKPDFVVTKQDAIDEGAFIDITDKFDFVRGMYKCPVVVTDTLWNRIVKLTKKRSWTSLDGYFWDILWASRYGVRETIDTCAYYHKFRFGVILDEKETWLWCCINTDESGRQYITIYFPFED